MSWQILGAKMDRRNKKVESLENKYKIKIKIKKCFNYEAYSSINEFKKDRKQMKTFTPREMYLLQHYELRRLVLKKGK